METHCSSLTADAQIMESHCVGKCMLLFLYSRTGNYCLLTSKPKHAFSSSQKVFPMMYLNIVFWLKIIVFLLSPLRLSVDTCECDSSVSGSLTDDQVLLSRSQNFLSFTSPNLTLEREIFEYFLRNVHFSHGSTRPSTNQYSAYVRVTVSDGTFSSVDSFTFVTVSVQNQPPSLTIGGQDSQEYTLNDGMDIFALAPQGIVSITEDSGNISSVSIELTNSQDSDERLLLSSAGLPASITGTVSEDGLTVTLTGPASASQFAQVLADSGLLEYSYPAYSSILQGAVPDFTQR